MEIIAKKVPKLLRDRDVTLSLDDAKIEAIATDFLAVFHRTTELIGDTLQSYPGERRGIQSLAQLFMAPPANTEIAQARMALMEQVLASSGIGDADKQMVADFMVGMVQQQQALALLLKQHADQYDMSKYGKEYGQVISAALQAYAQSGLDMFDGKEWDESVRTFATSEFSNSVNHGRGTLVTADDYLAEYKVLEQQLVAIFRDNDLEV